MQIQSVNRENAEKIFVKVKNVSGATITTGLPVAYALGISNDGVQAILSNTAAKSVGFMGVAVADIPDNDYGQVQIAGFVNSALISNVGTSITINAGDPLVPAPGGFASAAPTYANSGFKWLAAASNVPAAVSAAAYVSGLIRLS